MEKQILYDLSLAEITEVIKNAGFPSYRAKQLYSWICKGAEFNQMTDLPKDLIAFLSENYFESALSIKEKLTSKDGSVKFLYLLHDANCIEGIYMPHTYGDSVCVSTQVGCRMGCAFCASGIDGCVRDLSAGEILGQVIAAGKEAGGGRRVSNIVLMGSGEPLDNYDNVTRFLKLVTSENGLNISQRSISLSTCGLVPQIRRLADEGYSVTLSISLHATTDEHRRNLMPIANKYTISELISAAKYYFEKTGRRIIFEYSMVKGENMDYFDAKRLAELTKGYPSHVNLIMLNEVKEKNIKGCTVAEAKRFLQRLTDMGVSATIRKSFGNDVAGACGQLRRKYIAD